MTSRATSVKREEAFLPMCLVFKTRINKLIIHGGKERADTSGSSLDGPSGIPSATNEQTKQMKGGSGTDGRVLDTFLMSRESMNMVTTRMRPRLWCWF